MTRLEDALNGDTMYGQDPAELIPRLEERVREASQPPPPPKWMKTEEKLAQHLYSIGWDSPSDAQWTQITEVWRELRGAMRQDDDA